MTVDKFPLESDIKIIEGLFTKLGQREDAEKVSTVFARFKGSFSTPCRIIIIHFKQSAVQESKGTFSTLKGVSAKRNSDVSKQVCLGYF